MQIKYSVFVSGLLMLSGCGSVPANSNPYPASSRTVSSVALESNVQKTLIFMREEEKIARDVYRTLNQRWNNRVYTNISGAEQRHMNKLASKLTQYNLADPVVNDATGVFTNATLSGLYQQLVQRGSRSAVEGLRVAAYIEELDIRDLQNAIKESDNADLNKIYENLMRGSRNHLRAFVGQLSNQGLSYQAQLLSQNEVNQIINSARERGGHGGGQGRGQGRGQGHGGGQGRGQGRGQGGGYGRGW